VNHLLKNDLNKVSVSSEKDRIKFLEKKEQVGGKAEKIIKKNRSI